MLDDLLASYLKAHPVTEAVSFCEYTGALCDMLTSQDDTSCEDPQLVALARQLTQEQDSNVNGRKATSKTPFTLLEESLLRQLAAGTWAVDAYVKVGPRQRPIEATVLFNIDTEAGLGAGLLYILVYSAVNDFIRDILWASQAASTSFDGWDTWEYPRADLMTQLCANPYIARHFGQQPRKALEQAVEKHLLALDANNNITYSLYLQPLQSV